MTYLRAVLVGSFACLVLSCGGDDSTTSDGGSDGTLADTFKPDTTMNNDNSANIGLNLLGTTDYDCFVGSNEIKWNHSTKRLTAIGCSTTRNLSTTLRRSHREFTEQGPAS